jgi:hypothetical protein
VLSSRCPWVAAGLLLLLLELLAPPLLLLLLLVLLLPVWGVGCSTSCCRVKLGNGCATGRLLKSLHTKKRQMLCGWWWQLVVQTAATSLGCGQTKGMLQEACPNPTL